MGKDPGLLPHSITSICFLFWGSHDFIWKTLKRCGSGNAVKKSKRLFLHDLEFHSVLKCHTFFNIGITISYEKSYKSSYLVIYLLKQTLRWWLLCAWFDSDYLINNNSFTLVRQISYNDPYFANEENKGTERLSVQGHRESNW